MNQSSLKSALNQSALKRAQPAAAVRPAKNDWLIAAALVLIVVALYWPARHFDFVNLDDGSYVIENPHVLGGLTTENMLWAVTTVHRGYWIPLTWWSYMVDATIGGGAAGAFHVTNIAIHALNAALLFLLLLRLTGRRWASAIVAAAFAVHPLNVESVAWVTERKDVLSTLFMLLTIAAYARYVRLSSAMNYAAVVALFVLSLLAKPMTVTLPVVLLWLDVWPLRRVMWPPSGRWRGVMIEKLPLLAVAAAFAGLTVVTQRDAGALADLTVLPFASRTAYAVVGVAAYLLRSVWPSGLAVMYVFPQPLSGLWIVGATVTLALVTVVAWRTSSSRPAIGVGWLWFLVTIFPVSGVLQAGKQWTADRFTYVPMIGLVVAVVWAVVSVIDKRPGLRVASCVAAGVAVAGFAAVSRHQLPAWTNAEALWRQEIAIGPRGDTPRAHVLLGQLARERGRLDEAASQFEAALSSVTSAETTGYLAKVRLEQATAANAAGRTDEAVSRYRQALALAPWAVDVHNDLAALLGNLKRDDEALVEFAAAAHLDPRNEVVLTNYAIALARMRRDAEARAVFEQILRINPANDFARKIVLGK